MIISHKYPLCRAYMGISHRGPTLGSGYIQLSPDINIPPQISALSLKSYHSKCSDLMMLRLNSRACQHEKTILKLFAGEYNLGPALTLGSRWNSWSLKTDLSLRKNRGVLATPNVYVGMLPHLVTVTSMIMTFLIGGSLPPLLGGIASQCRCTQWYGIWIRSFLYICTSKFIVPVNSFSREKLVHSEIKVLNIRYSFWLSADGNNPQNATKSRVMSWHHFTMCLKHQPKELAGK